MYFPESANINKLRFSALAAASLMNLLKRQRDAFGLSIFDEDVRTHTLCKSSTMHSRLLLSYLQALIDNPVQNRATSTAKALHTIAEGIHKRSMVIIFSDMLEQTENLELIFAALQHLKYNKHEVVLFHVVDEGKEVDFDYENRPYLFIDMESGEKVRLHSNQVKDHYVKQMKAYKEALKVKCLQYKIDFVEADINQGFKKILQSYLVKRTKMGA